MPEITTKEAVSQLVAVLSEAFEGPSAKWSYFTDAGRESGLLGTLEKLDAEEASRPVGETTIAAHAHHVAFGLEASAAWIRGDRAAREWQESWSVVTVNEESWNRLQQRLRAKYEDLRGALRDDAAASAESMGVAIGALAHAAYHLGSIRQKLAAARREASDARE